MKATLVIDDSIYALLQRESRAEFGSSRAVSAYLDKLLRSCFSRKKSFELFGSTRKFDLGGYRDEEDRIS